MNKIVAIALLLGSIMSFTAYNSSYKAKNSTTIDNSFEIKLKIDKVKDNQYSLATTIELGAGSFVISPFSKDGIYGHFEISIPKTKQLVFNKKLVETPNSIEELDPIINEQVRFVRTNTTYQQNLQVIGKEDFEVSGLIEFVLEPSCIPYDVEFTIARRNGVMSIKKTKTLISKEYKL